MIIEMSGRILNELKNLKWIRFANKEEQNSYPNVLPIILLEIVDVRLYLFLRAGMYRIVRWPIE